MSIGSDVETIYKLEIDLAAFMPRRNGYYIDEVGSTASVIMDALQLNGITAVHYYIKLPPRLVILFQEHDTALKARFVIVCMDERSEERDHMVNQWRNKKNPQYQKKCEEYQAMVRRASDPDDGDGDYSFMHCEECGQTLDDCGDCRNTWCGNSPYQGEDWQ